MVCTIEGCSSKVAARGWCSKHYYRWRKYGDPLAVARPQKGDTESHKPGKSPWPGSPPAGRKSNGVPPEVHGTASFGQWARAHGYDPVTRTYAKEEVDA